MVIIVKRLMFRQGTNMRLYFLNLRIVWLCVLVCLAITVFSGYLGITDLSVLSTTITCAFAELGIHTGFIVWKSKVENCRKHKDVNRLESLESEEL